MSTDFKKLFPNLSDEEIKKMQVEAWTHATNVQFGEIDLTKMKYGNNYVFDGNGIFYVKKTDFAIVGKKINDFKMHALPQVFAREAFVQMLLPKIPHEIYLEIVSFFKEVMNKFNDAEAYAHVYYNKKTEKYQLHIPLQNVGKGSVRYDPKQNLDVLDRDTYVLVFECHSHNSMGEFLSCQAA